MNYPSFDDLKFNDSFVESLFVIEIISFLNKKLCLKVSNLVVCLKKIN